jgi:hypothetical protein
MSTYEIIASGEYIGDYRRDSEPDSGGNGTQRYKFIVEPAGVIKTLYKKHEDNKKKVSYPA